MTDEDDPRIGTVLDERYRIEARLSSGGMGTVYLGRRLGLERPVAVKFLLADFAARPDFVARFEREALAMSRLHHPNCVPVIDYGIEDAPYLILEFVPGESLEAAIANGPLPVPRALAIQRQVLAALAHAHAQGVIHRDVKPANIVLSDVEGTGDHARLLDFGLAKLNESPPATWSTASVAVGTPSYMSPEQARGETVDHRTDLYSCGVVLFEMLTGVKPFVAEQPLDVLRKHIEEPPPRLSDAATGRSFPPELEAFVRGFLAKDPNQRHASARAATEALIAIEQRHGFDEKPLVIEATRPRRDEAADRVSAPEPHVAAPRRRRTWPMLMLLGIAAAVVVATVAWLAREGATTSRREAGDVDAARTIDARSSPADATPRVATPIDAAVVAPPDSDGATSASIDAAAAPLAVPLDALPAAAVPPPLDASPPPRDAGPPPDSAPSGPPPNQGG